MEHTFWRQWWLQFLTPAVRICSSARYWTPLAANSVFLVSECACVNSNHLLEAGGTVCGMCGWMKRPYSSLNKYSSQDTQKSTIWMQGSNFTMLLRESYRYIPLTQCKNKVIISTKTKLAWNSTSNDSVTFGTSRIEVRRWECTLIKSHFRELN